MKSRIAALHKTKAISEKDKTTVKAILTPEFMSSEESDDVGSFTVRPLSWRSQKATDIMCCLDDRHVSSERSRRMTFDRLEGPVSDRIRPVADSRIYWVSFEFPLDYIAGNMLFFIVQSVHNNAPCMKGRCIDLGACSSKN